MQAITTVGLDIAKSVFQVHGVDAAGKVIIRRQLKRRHVLPFFEKLPACVVGMEACATSHHWSREIGALGHTVRLMPPAYVKPTSSGSEFAGRIGAAVKAPAPAPADQILAAGGAAVLPRAATPRLWRRSL